MSIATRPWAAAFSASSAVKIATILTHVSLLATALGVTAALAPGQPAAPAQTVIGHSVEGRPIRALRVGPASAKRKLLVVSSIHGNEPAGKSVIAKLRRAHPPRGTAVWLIEDANPDGAAANGRHNAHGVDLNRNFPYRWQPQDGVYESGPGPASEPETQAIQHFVTRVRPRVTVWYHQALRTVVRTAGDLRLQRLYSRLSGLPLKPLEYHGTVSSWQNSTFPGDTAFVVDRDGTIYQLVPTTIMCRHTVGLNYTAIGIEHVAQSDAQVFGNRRQLAASLRLTRSLQGRYGIALRNVIGHNENRQSPYHREWVARLRTQTHGDFPKSVMDGYRRRLARLPAPASLR